MFFSYTVVDKEGKETKGRVEAENRTNAITILMNRGYSVLSLEEESDNSINIGLFLRVRTRDMVIFSRQIATLFEAEISALRAFNLVAENVQNTYFRGILRDIAKSIEQGLSIEKAFLKHQEIFGEFVVSIIAVGEKSGTLTRSFAYIADHTERTAALTARIRKALTYPIFVIVMFFAVMVLMLVTVIPRIASILIESGAELPLITRAVIGASEFLQTNLILIILGVLLAVIGIGLYARTEEGRETLDSIVISLPLLGKLFREFYLVRFSRNLGVMLASEVSIVSSLQILSRVMVNRVYVDMVRGISSRVQQGMTLSAALENQSLVSENVTQIIRVGEETGELQKMLGVISDFYEQQLRDTVDTMVDLIQPAIIVFLGAGVGLLIGSVIIPIYSISSASL